MQQKIHSFFWGKIEQSHFLHDKVETETDFLIVGGGVSGLFSAYYLLEAGIKDIVLIEQNTIGSGSTGHSAGMLVCEPEGYSWSEFFLHYGEQKTRLFLNAQHEALKTVIDLINKGEFKCDFDEGKLLIMGEKESAEKKKILKDYQTRRKIHTYPRLIHSNELKKITLSNNYDLAEEINKNISLNPLAFAQELSKYLTKRGVKIYEKTKFICNEENVAETERGKIKFNFLLKGQGIYQRGIAHNKYLSTIAITQKLSERRAEKLKAMMNRMFIDQPKRSFYYGKMTRDRRLLIGYGDIKFQKKIKSRYLHSPHLRAIERFLDQWLSSFKLKIEYAWSAPYSLSHNYLPFYSQEGNQVCINGAGTQLLSIAMASFAVHRMLNKKHPLDIFFSK